VNTIAPAFVCAPTAAGYLTEAQLRQIVSTIPAGRLGEPEEFANTVRFLASPLAGFLTGQTLLLDGGRHLG
jgi:3-oxoacyl-[acyl-carrier protein] reductase